jgi:hypothetical protein
MLRDQIQSMQRTIDELNRPSRSRTSRRTSGKFDPYADVGVAQVALLEVAPPHALRCRRPMSLALSINKRPVPN